jgi:hypothetical protein
LFLHLVMIEVAPDPHFATATAWQSHGFGAGAHLFWHAEASLFLHLVAVEVGEDPHFETATALQSQGFGGGGGGGGAHLL